MKKILVVLLSLGLLVAFGATASALDVKFGGQYYVVGVYENNVNLSTEGSYSRAFFYTRTRLQPVFQVQDGLTLTTRLDALEKQWGNTNWKGGVGETTTSRLSNGNNGAKAQENIEFERAYVTFKTGIGQFDVGYQSAAAWGTQFADAETTKPRIKWSMPMGPAVFIAIYEKAFEADTSNVIGKNGTAYAGTVDTDNDNYYLAAIYNFKGGSTGVLYGYQVGNSNRLDSTTKPYNSRINLIEPYVKATFGPVFIEAELDYFFGNAKAYETVAGTAKPEDIKLDGLGAYVHAKVTLGPAYFGGQFGYSSGDDYEDGTKSKTMPAGAGADWNPALILLNDEFTNWTGGSLAQGKINPAVFPAGVTGATGVPNNNKQNTIFYNLYGGFNPTPKLNTEIAFTYATVDKKEVVFTNAAGPVSKGTADSNKLGMEVDVKASYKIYDNLTYMIGAGYLWTGDYFKGASGSTEVGNNYLLMNRLILSF